MTPLGLSLLAGLRRLGKSPELAVIVTDSWAHVRLAEDIGALAIYAKPEHWDCDWSPIAGLQVLYIPMDGDTPETLRLYKSIWAARPGRAQAFLDGMFCNLWYSRCAE